MDDFSILVYSVIGLVILVGGVIALVVAKDKKLTKEQKEKKIFDIAIFTLKDSLEIATIKTENELKEHCIGLVFDKINSLGYIQISKQEISTAVELAMDALEELIVRKFSK